MASWGVTLIAVFSVVTVLGASNVIYRRLLPAALPVIGLLAVAAVGVVAWGVVAPLASADVLPELLAPVAALGALAAFLATIVVRATGATVLGTLIFAGVWSVAVFPFAAVVAFSGLGPFGIRPIDQGGSLPVHVAAGASALGVLIAAGKSRKAVQALTQGRATLAASVAVLTVGWLGWLIGAELAINELAPLIVANALLSAAGGISGWVIVQRIRHQSTTLAAMAAGLISGLVGVTAGAPFYAPAAAFVVGLASGVFASLVTLRAVSHGGHQQWFLVGTHLVAGAVGLVVLALLASDLGFFFTGQYVFLRDQVVSIIFVGGLSMAVSMILWWSLRRVPTLVHPVAR